MSHVRMCDRCGDIFSERAEFTSAQVTRIVRKDGRQTPVVDQVDYCVKCAGSAEPPAPRLAITSSEPAERGRKIAHGEVTEVRDTLEDDDD